VPRADEPTAGRLNTVAATAFTIGGAIFALGAAVSQFGSGNPTVSASIYFTGGLFFNTGGYTSLLQVVNAPVPRAWRWWSYEPHRTDWLSAFLLFAGTIVFGINLLDSFLEGLTAQQVNRLIWTPDVVGCVLFLASGYFALAALGPRPPRDLVWWVVVVNQLGSALFMVSALAAYTRPATGSEVNADIANWGILTGALCFSFGGLLQAREQGG
jgi:hypothetical protein